jgi:hypothetical protein
MKIVINRISRMALAGMVMFGLVAELGAKDKLDILKLRQGYLFKEFNPVLDQKSRTLKVRTTIENSHGKLKPGMIANAVLNINIEGMPLVIPRTAIIDTGKRKVVWVKVSKRGFRAKTIQTGYESEGYVAVRDGLRESEEVVVEGNFLLDAQAQLFGGYENMQNTEAAPHQH